jgi:hypothetical protein
MGRLKANLGGYFTLSFIMIKVVTYKIIRVILNHLS